MKGSTLVAGALAASSVQAASLQNVFQANTLLDKAISALGLNEQQVLDSVPKSIQKVWGEMGMLFPKETSELEFITKPKSKINSKPDSEWDFVVQEHPEHKLRVNKVKDPKVLGIDPGVKQYTGYLDVEEEDKHFFYWFFESRNDPKTDPVILWLNGGPGCSSLTGLFFELGPSSIGSDIKPIYNPHAWNSNASVIFLDQPVNVGYSYSGSSGVSNTVAAGKDVYAFLDLFFKQFPQYASGQDFHIAGESYAGHYIPVFATEILSHPQHERSFNLTSVLIGNGLTDPLTQYPYYEPMACGEGGEPSVLEPAECEGMLDTLPRCLSLIESCYESESVWTCVPASIYCNNAQMGPYQKTGKNVYDMRKECQGELCYAEMKYMDEYLNLDIVKQAVGAEVDNFESCNFDINRNFLLAGDWMKPYHKAVTNLLNQGLPVLIYAGDKDFICNWLGNQAWSDALPWKHGDKFQDQPVKTWISSTTGDKAGKLKNYENFTFLRVYGGGHMVPFDQSENALALVNDWIKGSYNYE
ncbi:LAFA_0E01024g1_1 [Lachancea sp. 'fantastica']|nr:LAFA_0E01024g1_1 [Lachancea sp. 'fantastica']